MRSGVTCPEESIAEEEGEDNSEGGDHVGGQEYARLTHNWSRVVSDHILVLLV